MLYCRTKIYNESVSLDETEYITVFQNAIFEPPPNNFIKKFRLLASSLRPLKRYPLLFEAFHGSDNYYDHKPIKEMKRGIVHYIQNQKRLSNKLELYQVGVIVGEVEGILQYE